MIKLKILRWGDYPGLSGWVQWNHEGPYEREASPRSDEKTPCGHGQVTCLSEPVSSTGCWDSHFSRNWWPSPRAEDKEVPEAHILKKARRGAWVAQSVEHPTSAQVMISQFMSSSPTSGSVLTAQNLEPASDSVSPSLSDTPPSCSVSLCLKNKQTLKNK